MTTELQVKQEPISNTPADLIKYAIQNNADIDKLEKLIALQERWEANEAKKAYVSAISDFKSESIEIIKTKSGYDNRYQYAELADITNIVTPLLAKYGLSHSWGTKQEANAITVTCTLVHKLGYSESTSLTATPDTSGSKNQLQAIGSTVSYLQRYTFKSICGIAEKGQDNDGDGQPRPQEQPTKQRSPIIPQDVKDAIYNDVTNYLDIGDHHGVKETLSGFTNEEKLVIWGIFNSQQRAAITKILTSKED